MIGYKDPSHPRQGGEPPDEQYEESAPSDSRLLHYVLAIYRRRWIVLTTFIAVMTVTAVWTFTAMPVYEATSQLLIEAEQPNVLTFQDVVRQDQNSVDVAETQYRLLRSRALARRTLTALALWNRPPFGGASATTPAPSTGVRAVRDWINEQVHWVLQPLRPETPTFEPAGPDENKAESAAIDRLLGGVMVTPIRNSQLVEVTYESPDPRLAARVANELVNQYMAQAEDLRFQVSQDASGWLAKQLEEQRKALESSELALQNYLERNDAVSLDGPQNIVEQKLADLNAAVTKAKMDRIDKEAQYNQLLAIQNAHGALDSFPGILSNTYIQQLKSELSDLQAQQRQLRERFGDKHPTMVKLATAISSAQAKLDAEVAKVVESVRNQFLAAQAQERSLSEALETQKQNALAQNRQEIEFGVLQRDVTTNRQLYEALLQRAKEAGISSDLHTANVRVVDKAEVPRNPVLPNHRQDLMLGLLAAGVLAVGFALLLEHLDNRIKTPEEIATYLSVPCLGLVPRIALKGKHAGAPLINNGVPPKFTESFKGVRTNIQFSSAQEGSRSLVVASTGPGEGKTIVSTNLAIALAQLGQRVILIDADMRRPTVHSVLGCKQEPGLSNLLVGDTNPSQAVKASSVQGLWVLPAGRIPPNPAELLGSTRFKTFLNLLREQFDWVILDSPPVMTVTDASVLAHSASGVIFVVGSEMAHRGAARTAVNQLRAADGKVVGAVLNRVNLDRNRYYYADYYRRDYEAYHSAAS